MAVLLTLDIEVLHVKAESRTSKVDVRVRNGICSAKLLTAQYD